MNFETYTGSGMNREGLELVINGKSYGILEFEVKVNVLTEALQFIGGRQERIAVNKETQLDVTLTYEESAKLGSDLVGGDLTSMIAKEFDLEFKTEGETIVSGRSMLRSMVMQPDGVCKIEIYVSPTGLVGEDSGMELNGLKNDPDAVRREDNFKRFVASKGRRAGQTRLAEAYNDRFNFFKFQKARELNKEAAKEKRRNEIRAGRGKLFIDDKEVGEVTDFETSVTVNRWGRTEPKKVELEDLFQNRDESEDKPKQREAHVAKPKTRAIDL